MDTRVVVTIGIGDVKEVRENWDDERAEEFLARIGKYLQGRLVEESWDILETLASMDEAGWMKTQTHTNKA